MKSSISNIVLFDYQPGRAGQCAVDYLGGFKGFLQVDGYAGYEKTSATLLSFWAYARRKFIEAQTAQPKGKTGKGNVVTKSVLGKSNGTSLFAISIMATLVLTIIAQKEPSSHL